MNVMLVPALVKTLVNARLSEQEEAIELKRPDSAEDPDESFKTYCLVNDQYEVQTSKCIPRPNREPGCVLQNKQRELWSPDKCIFKTYNQETKELFD
jgi:hypothetical protein